eukprot:TRINITY_DN8598_c0_g2_i2.p1 TRINITY_DN8598_c0_g2~~TRINITY_DN8598_c0_g2_i2.p1  ORF type:complete len:127 (-),score=4.76 TRINITY_DN8598_c0_g2_i2:411-791(-)
MPTYSAVSDSYRILTHNPIPTFPCNYLSISSLWSWLRIVVHIINKCDLISSISNNSLMWTTSFNCEAIVSIDAATRELLCTKQTDLNTQYLNPIQQLRPVPFFTCTRDIIEAYLIIHSHHDETSSF